MQTSSALNDTLVASTDALVASTDALVAFLVTAPDDIIAYWIKHYDLHLFYRLPVLCRRTREHFQLGRRLAIAEAIGGYVDICKRMRHIPPVTIVWWLRHGPCQLSQMHSLFGPAIVFANGMREWYWKGNRHRGGDLPAFVGICELIWYRHGERHRRPLPGSLSQRPARIVWEYGDGAHVTCTVFCHGLYMDEWVRFGFKSNKEVDEYVDAAAGVPWRE